MENKPPMIFEISKDMATKDTPIEQFPKTFIDFVKDLRGKGFKDSQIAKRTGVLRMNIDKI